MKTSKNWRKISIPNETRTIPMTAIITIGIRKIIIIIGTIEMMSITMTNQIEIVTIVMATTTAAEMTTPEIIMIMGIIVMTTITGTTTIVMISMGIAITIVVLVIIT